MKKGIMFGKHFSSMYEGSMRGAGSAFFAVWGYVISHMMPCRGADKGTRVELNTEVVAFLIGEKPEVVQAQIERMCEPDPKSRTKVEGGRRLLRMGEFEFLVVNGDKYRAIRDEESRREQNREAQARHREKLKAKGALVVPAGESMAAAIAKRVKEDPITVADKAAIAEKWSKGVELGESENLPDGAETALPVQGVKSAAAVAAEIMEGLKSGVESNPGS